MSFKKVEIENLQFNPFTKIGKEWLLISAGNKEKNNTMTASWGAMGVIWGKNAITVYVRPQRYTKEFLDREETFTISVLPEEYRKALTYCGKVCGKGIDKIKEAGLTAYPVDGTTAIEEAELIFVCKKMYHNEITPEGIQEESIDAANYPAKDYHTMYIAEITQVLVKEK
ncbi:MAG: flavin reductase [Eubacteriales bacterium]|nr:flavin reductase [Eubacteriales bacterium]